MIKSLRIKNAFGVVEQDMDFRIKNLASEPEQYNQVLTDGGDKVMLFPSILAKNASGKSSILTSILALYKFHNEKDLKIMIADALWKGYTDSVASAGRGGVDEFVDASETSETVMADNETIEKIVSKVIENIHQKISRTGSFETYIEMEIEGDTILSVEASDEDIRIENSNFNPISLRKVFMAMDWVKLIPMIGPNRFAHRMDLTSYISDVLPRYLQWESQIIKDLSFEHRIDNRYLKVLNYIVDKFGYEASVELLKRIDPNIQSITRDVVDKSISIFLKGSDSYPISYADLSFGTRRIVQLIARFITMADLGGVVVIDEIENGLHPSLVHLLIEIFQSDELNKTGVQAIITTHNPILFERHLINPRNVFMYDKNSFKKLRDLMDSDGEKLYKRTEDVEKFVKVKNYLSDRFWAANKSESKSTVSAYSIDTIIEKLEDGM